MFDFDDRALDLAGRTTVTPPRTAPGQAVAEGPESAADLAERFSTEVACRQYLEQLRWARGFVCPHCGDREAPWRSSLGLVACQACRRLCAGTTGTLLAGGRTNLVAWFRALWEIASRDGGVPAERVGRALELDDEGVAFGELERLRGVLVRFDADRLRGQVDVDESYVSFEAPGPGASRERRRVIVLVAVEVRDGRLTRIRLRLTSGAQLRSAAMFVAEVVKPGTRVLTDGVKAYAPLAAMGYDHAIVRPNAAPDPSRVEMPNAERVAWLVQSYLDATGPIPPERLPYYLDELTFRFNQRAHGDRGQLFRRLLERILGVADAGEERRDEAVVAGEAGGAARRGTSSGVRVKASAEEVEPGAHSPARAFAAMVKKARGGT